MEKVEAEPQVAWVTNLPAPYRIPIYDAVGKDFKLRVYFASKASNSRGWNLADTNRTWFGSKLNTFSIRIGWLELPINSPLDALRILKGTSLLVLESWDSILGLHLIVLARLRRIPVIVFYESHEDSHQIKSKILHNLRKLFFTLASLVYTAGQRSTISVLDHGINSDKVRETFMSVDVDFFAQKATKVKEQAMLVGHRFLFVGQLVKRKNASNVIEAFSRINSETDSLRIVGSGREKKDLVDLARKSDSRSQIEFIEHLSPEELVKIYLNSNTLVMPSTQEVWGLVANEALASGMHVVVSELSGVAPNIDGMKGVYISKTDVTSIQVAMQLSKNEWTGRISNPEILNHGVREMSIDLTNAIRELI